jgi:hypothetical protein
MRSFVLITVIAVIGSLVFAVPQAEASTLGSCSSGVSADFNGDGYVDLAVGAPLGDTDTVKNAGIVNVFYGGPSGLDPSNTPAPQEWFQGPKQTNGAGNLAGTPEIGDKFGACLAAGDFNGDGKADLAIGAFGDNVGGAKHAGSVNVIYGTGQGLASAGNQWWNQNSPGIPDSSRDGNWFGAALAVGDFNGDGKADLAIGAPNETLGSATSAGAVTVIYGSGAGLTATGSQRWQQGKTASGTLQGHPESGDRFGASLAAGDFGGTGYDDLAIGAPGEGVYGHGTNEGVVQIVYGSPASGLRAAANQLWFQGYHGLKDQPETGDTFGASLATGDFNGDGAADLAVGVPLEDFQGKKDAGAVEVIYGDLTSRTLVSTGNQMWTQDSAGILDQAETGDHFGAALTANDFNGDGKADLVVGVPLEDDGSATDDGAINIIYGSANGLDATAVQNQFWHQGPHAADAGDFAENGDQFGAALASGDYDKDMYGDLVIGVPGENHGFAGQGAVITMLGSPSGITSTGRDYLDAGRTNVPGDPHAGDQWGAALG